MPLVKNDFDKNTKKINWKINWTECIDAFDIHNGTCIVSLNLKSKDEISCLFVNVNLLYDRFLKTDMMSLLPRQNKKLVYASKKFYNFDIPIVDKIFDFDVNFIRLHIFGLPIKLNWNKRVPIFFEFRQKETATKLKINLFLVITED